MGKWDLNSDSMAPWSMYTLNIDLRIIFDQISFNRMQAHLFLLFGGNIVWKSRQSSEILFLRFNWWVFQSALFEMFLTFHLPSIFWFLAFPCANNTVARSGVASIILNFHSKLHYLILHILHCVTFLLFKFYSKYFFIEYVLIIVWPTLLLPRFSQTPHLFKLPSPSSLFLSLKQVKKKKQNKTKQIEKIKRIENLKNKENKKCEKHTHADTHTHKIPINTNSETILNKQNTSKAKTCPNKALWD